MAESEELKNGAPCFAKLMRILSSLGSHIRHHRSLQLLRHAGQEGYGIHLHTVGDNVTNTLSLILAPIWGDLIAAH